MQALFLNAVFGSKMMHWLYLVIAIVAEVVATSALKASEGFSRLWPLLIVVLGYGIAFFCLALVMKHLQMGVVYALWSGVGIVLIMLAGMVLYRQIPDTAALIGVSLIVAGVLVINLFSKTAAH
mgnify:CR=1 FL=1